MQNIPCDVRAYRRFSIFFLQFRHLKQLAQKAWSPVRMAKSSILLPQALQLYVQLLHIRDPSPRRRRFASESRRVPQVLHRKQSMCQRLPALRNVSNGFGTGWGQWPYQVRMPCPLRGSARERASVSTSDDKCERLVARVPRRSLCTDTQCRPGPTETLVWQRVIPSRPSHLNDGVLQNNSGQGSEREGATSTAYI